MTIQKNWIVIIINCNIKNGNHPLVEHRKRCKQQFRRVYRTEIDMRELCLKEKVMNTRTKEIVAYIFFYVLLVDGFHLVSLHYTIWYSSVSFLYMHWIYHYSILEVFLVSSWRVWGSSVICVQTHVNILQKKIALVGLSWTWFLLAVKKMCRVPVYFRLKTTWRSEQFLSYIMARTSYILWNDDIHFILD
jgi:hypothetical protein